VLQIAGVLLFGASGVMKVFMFDKVSADVPSFGAFPKRVWLLFGLVELACVVGLAVPLFISGQNSIVSVVASVLAIETLVFVWVHVKYREVTPIIFSTALGLAMAYLAYGRMLGK
jgi:hypothetical protein